MVAALMWNPQLLSFSVYHRRPDAGLNCAQLCSTAKEGKGRGTETVREPPTANPGRKGRVEGQGRRWKSQGRCTCDACNAATQGTRGATQGTRGVHLHLHLHLHLHRHSHTK